MKAIVYHSYGIPSEVMKVEDVERPVLSPGKVLVKVHAASINAADKLLIEGDTLLQRLIAGGIRKPGKKILGGDIAGVVEAAGAGVTRFQPGDKIYGDISSAGFGGFAEYVLVSEDHIAPKPAQLTFVQAAAVPLAGMTALQGLRDKGEIQPGQTVLITGASGGVGSFAVQLAKHFGASVTATASTGKLEEVLQLGADRVIDYTREDITKSGLQFDLIFDIAAYRPFSIYRPIMKPGGRYVLAGGSISRILKTVALAPLASKFGSKTFTNVMQKADSDDLRYMNSLLESGAIKPVIDRCYPLEQVAAAFTHFKSHRVCGKVVIGIASNEC